MVLVLHKNLTFPAIHCEKINKLVEHDDMETWTQYKLTIFLMDAFIHSMFTTGWQSFAVCQRHTVKPVLHTAKDLL